MKMLVLEAVVSSMMKILHLVFLENRKSSHFLKGLRLDGFVFQILYKYNSIQFVLIEQESLFSKSLQTV